jgi:DNA-binding transcriptional regulator YhcF (GntR family)
MTKASACQESTVAFNSGEFKNAIKTAMIEKNLDPSARHVLRVLLDYAHNKPIVWPSTKALMRDTGCSEHTIIRQIKNLERNGFLRKSKKQKSHGLGNEYTILIPLTTAKITVVSTNNHCKNDSSTTAKITVEPLSKLQSNLKENINNNISENFEKFFQAHPRHDKNFKKEEALKAYTQALQKTTPAILGLAVMDYAKARRIEIEKNPENRKYTLSVQSWLNKEKWKDVGSDGLTAEQRFSLQEKRTQENKKLEHSMEEAGERNEMIIRVMRKIKTIRFHIRRYYDLFSKEYPWENTLAWEEKFEEFALSRENLKNAR